METRVFPESPIVSIATGAASGTARQPEHTTSHEQARGVPRLSFDSVVPFLISVADDFGSAAHPNEM